MSREQIALEVHFEGCAEIGLTPERIGSSMKRTLRANTGPREQRIGREAAQHLGTNRGCCGPNTDSALVGDDRVRGDVQMFGD